MMLNDRELYRQILGITPPWDVTEVKLDLKNRWGSKDLDRL